MTWKRRKKGLSSFLRRREQRSFVEARPGLFEFVTAFRYQRGLARWVRLGWGILTLPIRACWRLLASIASVAGASIFGGFQRLKRRRVRHLIQGVPALIAASAVVATASIVSHRQDSLEATYRDTAAARFAAEDWKAARLYYERLFRLDGGSSESRLMLGRTLEEMGNFGQARELIEGVAVGDGGGHPRANHWVASKLSADPNVHKDPERLREIHKHLLLAERGLPGDPDIQLDLAKFYLAIGQQRLAAPRLAAAAKANPALTVDLARLYAAIGQGDAALGALETAEQHFRDHLETAPEDRQARLQLANVMINLGRADDALAVLREGLTFDPDGPYRQVISRVYLSIYDRLAAQNPRDYRAMIAALREALRHDPQSVEAAERLVGFGDPGPQNLSSPPDAEIDRQSREMLQQLLVSGEQPAAVHMALGLKAWRTDDLETAGFHFQRAYDLDSSLSGVANNLAWVLAHQKEPDLEQALATIEPAIERFPEIPHFRDTRGEIYLRMERWEDALDDLERALPSMQGNPRLHESLATVYEQLGHADIARQHRREAEQIREKNAKSPSQNRSNVEQNTVPADVPQPTE